MLQCLDKAFYLLQVFIHHETYQPAHIGFLESIDLALPALEDSAYIPNVPVERHAGKGSIGHRLFVDG
jgi:hypothetical protein